MATDGGNDPNPPTPNASEAATLYARIGGRVQGVGFRFYVLRCARDLRLAGRVRNRSDGDVEVWAQGPRPALEAFEAMLREGPPLSRVERVAVRWGVPVEPADDFRIDF